MYEIPCPRLAYNEPGTTYTVLQFPDDVHASVATIPTTLRFMARDCDPSTGVPDADQGYRDEYMVFYSFIESQISFSVIFSIKHDFLRRYLQTYDFLAAGRSRGDAVRSNAWNWRPRYRF